jgi:hypothetical protein
MSSKKAHLLSTLSVGLCLAGLGLAVASLSGCQTWTRGMTLPSGRYLQHPPQYIPPSPPFPLSRELAAQEAATAKPAPVTARAASPGNTRHKSVAVKLDALEEFALRGEQATFNNFCLAEVPPGSSGALTQLTLKGCYRNRTARPLNVALVVVGLDADGAPLWACTLSTQALARDVGCLSQASVSVPAGTLKRTTTIQFSANLAAGAGPRKAASAFSSDPNVRIQELLNSSEDLRQIEYEWRRIWFNDQPSHMTPERVHGGNQ